MNLKNRLTKLEQAKRNMVTEAACICFPPNEPPKLLLEAERDAASGVLCPVHGQRFSRFAGPLIYGEVNPLPAHLHLRWQSRSPQYVKAMAASFPSDGWPAMGGPHCDSRTGLISSCLDSENGYFATGLSLSVEGDQDRTRWQ